MPAAMSLRDEMKIVTTDKVGDASTGVWYSVLCHDFSLFTSRRELYNVQEEQGGRMHQLP